MNLTTEIKDFVMLPRKIRDDYSGAKLSKNEFFVLIWIWLNVNPVNGSFHMSYEGLRQDFQNDFSNDSARQIISSLRKGQYIYFTNHKGRGGGFPIYPTGFKLTNGKIQTLEYLKNKELITTQAPIKTQPDTIPKHNSSTPNHNFSELKSALIKQFSINNPIKQITTPYNDNDNKNNKYNIDSKILLRKSENDASYNKKIIPVDSFNPKIWEEEQCRDIARALGETDMRFILSCYHKNGFNHIERAWGIFKDIPKDNIDNKAKYFNKLIRNLAEK